MTSRHVLLNAIRASEYALSVHKYRFTWELLFALVHWACDISQLPPQYLYGTARSSRCRLGERGAR